MFYFSKNKFFLLVHSEFPVNWFGILNYPLNIHLIEISQAEKSLTYICNLFDFLGKFSNHLRKIDL